MSDSTSLRKRPSQPSELAVWQKILHGIFPDGTVKHFKNPETLSASRGFVNATRQLGTIDLPDGNTSGVRTRIPGGTSNIEVKSGLGPVLPLIGSPDNFPHLLPSQFPAAC